MISRELAYVTLVVDDVEGIASLLERQFELTRCEAAVDDGSRMLPVLAVGQSAIVLCEPGDAFVDGYHRTGVHHIALAVENVEAASHHAMNAGVDLAAPESVEGVNGGRRVLLSPGHTGGIRTYLCDSLSISRGTSGLVERIDHLGVASDDCDGTLEAFVTRLGLVWEDTETDIETTVAVETFVSRKYGVTQITRPPLMVAGVRADFITVGDCELEVIQEIDPEHAGQVQHGTAGTTSQDKGAIARYVANRGAGLHHIAFKVPDIAAGLSALGKSGVRLIDTVGRPGGRRSQIGFIHPRGFGGVLAHLVQREDNGSPGD